MEILIKTLAGKAIRLEVVPSDTIEIIKKKIQDREGVHPDEQRIFIRGRGLQEDSRTMIDYEVIHGTTLFMSISLRVSMRVHVKH